MSLLLVAVAFVTSSFLFLVVGPGAIVVSLLVVRPGATSSVLATSSESPLLLYYSSFLFLVARPGATSNVLATSSDALCY